MKYYLPVLFGLASADESAACIAKDLKIWIHQDVTASFKTFVSQAPEFLEDLLQKLHDKYSKAHVFDFGYSTFTDRDGSKEPGPRDYCYKEAVAFGNDPLENKISAVKQLLQNTEIRYDFGDFPEDCMSALPYVSKNRFGPPNDNEVRLFIIVTDSYGKFEPDYHGQLSGNKTLEVLPEDGITCDVEYQWPTIDQIFKPVEAANVIPVIVSQSYARYWEDIMHSAISDYVVHPFSGSWSDTAAIVDSIGKAVDYIVCPSSSSTTTTTTTTASTSSSSSISSTSTSHPSTDSPATTTTTTTTTTESHSHPTNPTVIPTIRPTVVPTRPPWTNPTTASSVHPTALPPIVLPTRYSPLTPQYPMPSKSSQIRPTFAQSKKEQVAARGNTNWSNLGHGHLVGKRNMSEKEE